MRTRTHNWFDAKKKKIFYGFQVFVNGKWMHAGDDKGKHLFKTAKERDEKQKEVRKHKEQSK